MKMAQISSGLVLLILIVFLGGAPIHVRADEHPASAQGSFDGVYELKDVTAAGVYSAEEEKEAQDFVGYFLTLHGEHVVLPNSVLCHIATSEHRILRNDRESFGTAGGSWSEVGLQESVDGGYEVTEMTFDCGSDSNTPFRGLVIQPETQTVLLSYWSVFLILGRE